MSDTFQIDGKTFKVGDKIHDPQMPGVHWKIVTLPGEDPDGFMGIRTFQPGGSLAERVLYCDPADVEVCKLEYVLTFKRACDGKIFKSTYVLHWVEIKAEDGEEDTVKWFGPDAPEAGYVSREKGFKYVKVSAAREIVGVF